MIEKIKQHIKAWKRLYTQDCPNVNENSSWREILAEQEYYNADKYSVSGQQKRSEAVKTIGTFSEEEKNFLEKLPAYKSVRMHLVIDGYRDEFVSEIDGVKVYCMCLAQTEDIPIREYTIVTERKDLWGLETFGFRYSRFRDCRRLGIIRFAKEPPADFCVPEDDSILPV